MDGRVKPVRSKQKKGRKYSTEQTPLFCSTEPFHTKECVSPRKKKYKLGPITGAEDLNTGPRTAWRGAGGHGRDGGRARAAVFTDVIKLIPAHRQPAS